MRLGVIATALGIILSGCSGGAGKCGDLASVGAGCPPTFDGTEANLPVCRGYSASGAQQAVWHCQDLIILLDSYGLGGAVCTYDATSHALVGAESGGDISATCEAGRTKPMCRENAPTLQRPCDRPDAGGPTPDAGKCVGDLATVGSGCPATFDGTEANLPACGIISSMGGDQLVWHCQDLIILVDSYGLGGDVCYYDATSHALVGAEQASDIGVYCGQTSLTIEAGRTNPMCRENAPTLQRPCDRPDAAAGQ